jgi:PIN domain
LKTEIVLVDFENVQPTNMAGLTGGPYKVKVFVGANQAKVPLETARALQALGPDAEYIQIDGNGRNALDFHIAYYIGRLATENPKASFHVISKDKGFDPLIRHLTKQGLSCRRSEPLASTRPTKKKSKTQRKPERVDAVITNLAKRKAAKPRTLKTLRSTINACFRKEELAEKDLDQLVELLTDRGVIEVSDGKVHYK